MEPKHNTKPDVTESILTGVSVERPIYRHLNLITVHPDSIYVSGPNKDGGYTLKLTLGEYEAEHAAELLKIPKQTNLKLTVEWDI